MSRSSTLCVFLFLGICMGIVTATARDPERENKELFGRRWTPISLWVKSWRERNIQATPSLSSPPPLVDPTLLWHHHRHHHHHHPPHVPWGHHHRHHPNNPTPPPKPPLPPHMAPQPTQPPHVAPSLVDNVVPPWHATPQPALPPHTTPLPVDDVVPPPPLPPHAAPLPLPSPSSSSPPTPLHEACMPPPPPSSSHSPAVKPPPPALSGGESSDCLTVLINVDGCVSELITSFFKDEISLSTGCCKVVSRISDDCFYRGFTQFRVPIFLSKVMDYCGH
ncbi:protein TRACHEARY ELEMENT DIFFERENTIATION-RELATED 7A-like [Lycium ferocissimum]|uniref:protein TRACHEARY ELEMENT DIFFERENTIATION-RELATED 7A-like n=1 Tax=Lycium ferocissimum TaxID=112874 RepID=UPI0028153C3B|nr:protein TRACHEARY ELEMENT DIFFERENTIATION-RELATED 7A-like [Lycium ferocissimum]